MGKMENSGKGDMMKKAIKIVIAGIVVVSVIVVAIIVKQHISITSDGRSVSIIGGADGPTSVFLIGKIDNRRVYGKF